MKAILLDTNGYTAFKRGYVAALEVVRRAPRLTLTSVVIGELLAGFAGGTRAAANRADLDQFLASERVSVVAVDELTAAHYATVYHALRVKGRPVPTNDMWIAASALQYALALFTLDAHFQEIDGLIASADPSELLR